MKEVTYINNKQIGRNGIAAAIWYYTKNGYTISLPINDTQWYDLVIEKDNEFKTVQCKATKSKTNGISLRSNGGNNGRVHYYSINTPVDIIFCLDGNNYMYAIPMKDIIAYNLKYFITLKSSYVKNYRGFPSYKYCVDKLYG